MGAQGVSTCNKAASVCYDAGLVSLYRRDEVEVKFFVPIYIAIPHRNTLVVYISEGAACLPSFRPSFFDCARDVCVPCCCVNGRVRLISVHKVRHVSFDAGSECRVGQLHADFVFVHEVQQYHTTHWRFVFSFPK